MTEHSPTPFSTMPAAPNNYWVIKSEEGFAFAKVADGLQANNVPLERLTEQAYANAHFIVEACNAFEPLLAYVRAFRDYFDAERYSDVNDAFQALPDATRKRLETNQ